MAPAVETLVQDFRVYAPDLPGFGDSEERRCVLGISGLADSLAALMEATRLDRVVLAQEKSQKSTEGAVLQNARKVGCLT